MASPLGSVQRKAPRERLFTKAFVLAWFVQFTHALGMNTQVHLPGFFEQLGAGKVMIGGLALAFAVAAILARPLTGELMDRFGRRVVLLGGGALHVLLAVLFLTVHSLGPWLVTLRAGQGVVEALLFAGFMTYAADIVPASRRTQGLAWFGLGGLLPVALGGILGDLVLEVGTYEHLFLVMIALAVVGLLLTWPLPEPPRSTHGEPTRGFLAALTQRDLLPVWFMGCVFASSLTAVLVFLKSYVLDTGIGSVGIFLSGYVLAATFLRLFFGWLPDRIGYRRTLVPALIAVGVGVGVLAFTETATGLCIAGVICGLGHGTAFPTGVSLVVTRARPSERGAAVSIYTAIFPMGMLFGPAFGALIAWKGYSAGFLTAAMLSFVGALIYYLWDRRVAAA